MSLCLCCDSTLLRNFHHGQVYLFCPHCRQDMLSAEHYLLGNPLKLVKKTASTARKPSRKLKSVPSLPQAS